MAIQAAPAALASPPNEGVEPTAVGEIIEIAQGFKNKYVAANVAPTFVPGSPVKVYFKDSAFSFTGGCPTNAESWAKFRDAMGKFLDTQVSELTFDATRNLSKWVTDCQDPPLFKSNPSLGNCMADFDRWIKASTDSRASAPVTNRWFDSPENVGATQIPEELSAGDGKLIKLLQGRSTVSEGLLEIERLNQARRKKNPKAKNWEVFPYKTQNVGGSFEDSTFLMVYVPGDPNPPAPDKWVRLDVDSADLKESSGRTTRNLCMFSVLKTPDAEFPTQTFIGDYNINSMTGKWEREYTREKFKSKGSVRLIFDEESAFHRGAQNCMDCHSSIGPFSPASDPQVINSFVKAGYFKPGITDPIKAYWDTIDKKNEIIRDYGPTKLGEKIYGAEKGPRYGDFSWRKEQPAEFVRVIDGCVEREKAAAQVTPAELPAFRARLAQSMNCTKCHDDSFRNILRSRNNSFQFLVHNLTTGSVQKKSSKISQRVLMPPRNMLWAPPLNEEPDFKTMTPTQKTDYQVRLALRACLNDQYEAQYKTLAEKDRPYAFLLETSCQASAQRGTSGNTEATTPAGQKSGGAF